MKDSKQDAILKRLQKHLPALQTNRKKESIWRHEMKAILETKRWQLLKIKLTKRLMLFSIYYTA